MMFIHSCRYLDIMPRFAMSVPQLSMITNMTMNFVFDRWGHLLQTFEQEWLSPTSLQQYAQTIHFHGAPSQNCWGFIDGTVRRVCRPGQHQRVLYNRHKKVHAIKFQSLVAPNGMCANLYGPVEGRRHDSTMLAKSRLLESLQLHSRAPDGSVLCIYGDPAYPLRQQLLSPFRGAQLNEQQKN